MVARDVITVVPCTPAHVATMQRRVESPLTPAQLVYAVTVMSEGEPLCCWGITPLWDGVGHAWFLERQPLTGHPLASRIARAVWRQWRVWQSDFRYVEALPLAERHDSCALIAWLGFWPVHLKEGYGPGGEAMMLYEWRAHRGC